MRRFEDGHPLVSFLYFFVVIGITIMYWHPMLLGISLVGAVSYLIYLKGIKGLAFHLKITLPMAVLAAVINPLVNHQGVTVLFFLSGHAITKESVWYGISAATMIYAVCIWFACYQQVITSDRFMAIFGKKFPTFTLLFAMVLRFVPHYTKHHRKMREARKQFQMNGNIKGKSVTNQGKVMEGMTTWALESAVDTADAMQARGYGVGKRSHYGRFHFTLKDGVTLGCLLVFIVGVLYGMAIGIPVFWYFPKIVVAPMEIWFFVVYGMLVALPLWRNGWEEIRWNYILWRK